MSREGELCPAAKRKKDNKMLITIIIIFFCLIALLILHEFGHFLAAKKLGVKVEEFGVGYPPRIFGKKIGETVYSLNLLPFGAFVKIHGEEGQKDVQDWRSFSARPVWQRALILMAGVLSFWVVAFLILTVVGWAFGVPRVVEDEAQEDVVNAQVQILDVAPGSPAEKAGIKIGDIITKVKGQDLEAQTVDKVKEVQEFTEEHLGQEVILTIQRGKDVFEKKLTPRILPPEEEGAMGVALARTANVKYSWYEAPQQAFLITCQTTVLVPQLLARALAKWFQGEKVTGLKLVGPVGIGEIMGQALSRGWGSFLFSLSMISIFLALSNLLPVPALDGGRLLFLAVEKIRKKAIDAKIEAKINSVFFALLLMLMALVTFRDIWRIFS